MNTHQIAGSTQRKGWRRAGGFLLAAWFFLSAGAALLQLARQNLAAAVVLRHLPLLADPTGLPRTDLCVNMTAGEEGGGRQRLDFVGGDAGNSCLPLLQSRLACAVEGAGLAQPLLVQAEVACPRAALLHEWAGQLAWSQGGWQTALEHWLALPYSNAYLFTQASNLARQGDLAAVRLLAEHSLIPMDMVNPPQVPRLYTWVATAYQQEGDWANAARVYQVAVERAPDAGILWMRLGSALRRDGQLTAALTALQRSIVLLVGEEAFLQGLAYDELGRVRQEQGQSLAAADAFARALGWYRQSTRSSATHMAELEVLVRQLREGADAGILP